MFHAARLFCFQVLGDFRTAHKGLIELFSSREAVGFKTLDWLHKFDKAAPSANGLTLVAREIIVQHLRDSLGIETSDAEVGRLAQLLHHARGLRNDTNYESVLIANEHNHCIVSACAEQLATTMADAVRLVAEFLRRVLVAEVERGPDNSGHRSDFKRLVRDQLSILSRQFTRLNPDPTGLDDYIETVASLQSDLPGSRKM